MSQFCRRDYFGYRFTPAPGKNDWFRPKVTVPVWGICLLPYFNGGDVWVSIRVRPIAPTTKQSQLSYVWAVSPKDKDVNWDCPSGKGTIQLPTDSLILDLGHFPFSGEYVLKFEVMADNKTVSQSLVDYDFLRRAEVIINAWWILLSVALGYIVARLTA